MQGTITRVSIMKPTEVAGLLEMYENRKRDAPKTLEKKQIAEVKEKQEEIKKDIKTSATRLEFLKDKQNAQSAEIKIEEAERRTQQS